MKNDEHPSTWGRTGDSRGLQGPRQRRMMPKLVAQHAPSVVRDPYATQGPPLPPPKILKFDIGPLQKIYKIPMFLTS